MNKKPKTFSCYRDFERYYLPKSYAVRLEREEREALGLGGVIARKMLRAKHA